MTATHPPLQLEPYGRYDGHNRRPGAAAGKRAMANRYHRRRTVRQLQEQAWVLNLVGLRKWTGRP